MNEDYLWNRKGTDPEIERLENALEVLRYQATAPPEIPARIVARTEKPARSYFGFGLRLAFATAAFAVLAVIWFQLPASDTRVGNDPGTNVDPVNIAAATLPDSLPDTVTKPAANDKPALTIYRVRTRQAPRPTKAVAIAPKRKTPAVKLTAEERSAYDQLMLALSITSSKLKIVRDTIAGIDESETVYPKVRDIYKK